MCVCVCVCVHRGMANKTHWIVAAACGVWASDTTYAKQNGGPYDFLIGDACALPKDQVKGLVEPCVCVS